MWRMLTMAALVAAVTMARLSGAQTPNPESWTIPQSAFTEKSPLTDNAKAAEQGKQVYTRQCQRCHGPAGRGDGPEAEPDFKPADLTDAARGEKNPDGVLFYKIWNGRTKPKMPAFKTELSRNEVWSVVSYIKTLRKTS
jgi:mono/diheme cytochrome c family protein